MAEFQIGSDPCTVVRTGINSFDVFPLAGGRHVLELVDTYDSSGESYFCAYLDGVLFDTSGVLGIWDLLTEVVVGDSYKYEAED